MSSIALWIEKWYNIIVKKEKEKPTILKSGLSFPKETFEELGYELTKPYVKPMIA